MAWSDPKAWLNGELVAADDLNLYLRDNALILKVAVTDAGKIRALNSTYLEDTSGGALTDVVVLNAANDFTAGVQDFSAGAGTRLVLPIGANKWAT